MRNNNFKTSLSSNTKVNVSDLYSYLARVLSCFEGKEYHYTKAYLQDLTLINKKFCYHILSTNNVRGIDERLTTVQELDNIRHYSSKGDVVILSDKDRPVINLVDDNLKVNLADYLLTRYPYLEMVLLDLANLLIENYGSVSYRKLALDIEQTYRKEIIYRKKEIEENQEKELALMRKNDEEIMKIIKCVESSELSASDKLMIKYNLEKHIKIRRPYNA